jgi:hypothetical protein
VEDAAAGVLRLLLHRSTSKRLVDNEEAASTGTASTADGAAALNLTMAASLDSLSTPLLCAAGGGALAAGSGAASAAFSRTVRLSPLTMPMLATVAAASADTCTTKTACLQPGSPHVCMHGQKHASTTRSLLLGCDRVWDTCSGLGGKPTNSS